MQLNGNTIIYIKTHDERRFCAAPPPRRGDVTRRQRQRSRFARRPHNNVPCRLATAVGAHCTKIGGCYCEHALTTTQPNTKHLDCCANQIAVAGRPHPNRRNYTEHRRARYLNWHLPKRILHIHFAQHDAYPATESLPQIQDMPDNIAQYVTELTRKSRRKTGVFVDACH